MALASIGDISLQLLAFEQCEILSFARLSEALSRDENLLPLSRSRASSFALQSIPVVRLQLWPDSNLLALCLAGFRTCPAPPNALSATPHRSPNISFALWPLPAAAAFAWPCGSKREQRF